ncbi:MAG: hypothetical protein GEU86_08255 [Actinophytocola sp.]|nr:hypothetical protein [Actinophytocola sp.]
MDDVDSPAIVLATSNGTGMGHLARAAATALACDGRARPVVFSLSQALPVVTEFGLRGEFCARYPRLGMREHSWQRYLAERIAALVAETGARAFAFDGAWPYAGLQLARAALPDIAFVWIRRAMWRPGANQHALHRRGMFDLVIEPGDLAGSADHGATAALDDARKVPPVTLLEGAPPVSRREAAAKLGLDPDRPAALVTLRADSLDEDSASAAAVRTVLARPGWQVALTRTPLSGEELTDDDRVMMLRGVFPLASYLSAFDIAVTEAGYNAAHEVLHAAVPAVLVPTSAAVTDDQAARANWAAGEGLALTAREDEPDQVAARTAELLDPDVRVKLADRCAQLPPPTGAAATAELLREFAGGFDRHRFTVAERARIARLSLRPLATRLLPRSARPARPEFVSDVTVPALRQTPPPEHVLAGSSAGYLAARERIARRYYH